MIALKFASVLVALSINALPCAFNLQPTPQYNPLHFINNDPMWEVFDKANVISDDKKGEYQATFPPELLQLEGTRIRIAGFMMPLETNEQALHFILVRRNTACPFCPPNKPTEAVEVFNQDLVKYTGEEITVMGHLTLVSSSAEGLFFRLDRAQVLKAG